MFDPEAKTWQEGLPVNINKTLKRRYFLVEKAKNANVIGIPATPTAIPAPSPSPPYTPFLLHSKQIKIRKKGAYKSEDMSE